MACVQTSSLFVLSVLVSVGAVHSDAAVRAKKVWVNPCSLSPAKSMPMCNMSLSFETRVANLVTSLTQAEKIGLFGTNAAPVPRLNIPEYEVSSNSDALARSCIYDIWFRLSGGD